MNSRQHTSGENQKARATTLRLGDMSGANEGKSYNGGNEGYTDYNLKYCSFDHNLSTSTNAKLQKWAHI